MKVSKLLPALVMIAAGGIVSAQQPGQPELRIEPANRTLAVSAEEEVSVERETHSRFMPTASASRMR